MNKRDKNLKTKDSRQKTRRFTFTAIRGNGKLYQPLDETIVGNFEDASQMSNRLLEGFQKSQQSAKDRGEDIPDEAMFTHVASHAHETVSPEMAAEYNQARGDAYIMRRALVKLADKYVTDKTTIYAEIQEAVSAVQKEMAGVEDAKPVENKTVLTTEEAERELEEATSEQSKVQIIGG